MRVGLLAVAILAIIGCRESTQEEETWKKYRDTGVVAFQQGRYAEAEAAWQQALALTENFAAQDRRRQRILSDLAQLYVIQGESARAESLYLRLLDLYQQTPDSRDSELAATLERLAELKSAQGESARAESLYLRLLDLYQQTPDSRDPRLASILGRLADLYRQQGQFSRADSLAKRALGLKLQATAHAHFIRGESASAETFYRRALEVQERNLGKDHPDLAATCYDLGRLYQTQGDTGLAKTFYRRALTIQERRLPPDHPELERTRNQLQTLASGR